MSTFDANLPVSATSGIAAEAFELDAPSPWQIMRLRARSHPGFLIGGTIVLFAFFVAILASYIAPFDPYDQNLSSRLINPVWDVSGSWAHPFGTDGLGRDFLSRLIYGTRVSLSVGFFAALIAGLVGATLGVIGGYFGGRIDAAVIWLVNVKLALPPILVALSLISVVGGSLLSLILIIGFLSWDRYAVVTRSITQQLRQAEFISAAKAAGAGNFRVILSEVLPNILNQIIVVASLEMALAISVEAVLSFLGLGIKPPTPSWGLMVAEGRSFMFFKPYLILIPGFALFILVIAINMLGDGIRDITAPEGRS